MHLPRGRSITKAGGKSLDPGVRSDAERRFRQDFNNVRVHSDDMAHDIANSMRASAVTVGEDILFARGRLNENSHKGRSLLGHELAHVVQQRRGGVDSVAAAESDARLASERFAFGSGPVEVAARTDVRAACSDDDEKDVPFWKKAKKFAGNVVDKVADAPSQIKEAAGEQLHKVREVAGEGIDNARAKVGQAVGSAMASAEIARKKAEGEIAKVNTSENRAKLRGYAEGFANPTQYLAQKSSAARAGWEKKLEDAKHSGTGVDDVGAMRNMVVAADNFVQAWNKARVEPGQKFAAGWKEGGLVGAIDAWQASSDETMKGMTDAFKQAVNDYEDGKFLPPTPKFFDPKKHPTLAKVEGGADYLAEGAGKLSRQAQGGVVKALWSMGAGLQTVTVHPVNTLRGLGELPGPGGPVNPIKMVGQAVGAIDDYVTSKKSGGAAIGDFFKNQLPDSERDQKQTANLLKGLGENYIEAAGFKMDPKDHSLKWTGDMRLGEIPGLLLVDVGSFFIPGSNAGKGAKAADALKVAEGLGDASKVTTLGKAMETGTEVSKLTDLATDTGKLADVTADTAKSSGAVEATAHASDATSAGAKSSKIGPLEDALQDLRDILGDSKPANDVVPSPPSSSPGGKVLEMPSEAPRQPNPLLKDGPRPVTELPKKEPIPESVPAVQEQPREMPQAAADVAEPELKMASGDRPRASSRKAPATVPNPPPKPIDVRPNPTGPPTKVYAPGASGKKRVPAKPLGEPITAQPKGANELPPGYGDMPEHTGMHDTSTPRGRQPNPKTVAGNFMDKYVTLLEEIGLDPAKALDQGRDFVLPDKPPPTPIQHQPVIPHPDYPPNARPRADALRPDIGGVGEMKPTHLEDIGRVEAQQYAEWLDKYAPLPEGARWQPHVITYHQDVVIKFLEDLGYLMREAKEKGKK